MHLLAAEEITVWFGGLAAVQDVSFRVSEGEIVSLIGPNGAGKTTIVNVLTGFVRPTAGTVRFEGKNIVGRRPERLAALGLVRTFQNAAMFTSMSVVENLATGSFLTQKARVWQTLLRTTAYRREDRSIRARVDQVLESLGMQTRRDNIASELPYGEQRVLGLGIAMMAQPKFLVLDEPAAGLSPDEARIMAGVIRTVHTSGITVLLVEHNMPLVMSISDRIIVLKEGKKLAEGVPDIVRQHPEVIEAYLGTEA